MTSRTRHYNDAASQARHAADKTADVWTQGARGMTGLIPRPPQIDLIPAVERYVDFVQRTVDINRYIAVKWVEAAGRLTGAVRDQAESATGVVREMPASVGHVVHEQAAKAGQAEREQARQAHDSARECYEGLTKAELSDQLAQRDLPKTGNLDELIERLVEAETE
jgi:SAP domain